MASNMIIHRIISKVIARYKKRDVYLKTRKMILGKDVDIQFPILVGGDNRIEIGQKTTILAGARLQVFSDLVEGNPQIIIGSNCYFGFRLTILAGADIRIGNNVLIASDVSIVSHNHGMNPESKIPYMDQPLAVSDIAIGDNCWIADKVVITSGVKIGRGCIIGAGSIVTHDIPQYSIAVGIPAKVIKKWDFEKHRWNEVK